MCIAVANFEGKTINANDWFKSATAKFDLKDYEGAVADLTRAIELKPDFAEAYYNRGLGYLQLDQKSKAMADFLRAIELGRRIPQSTLDFCK